MQRNTINRDFEFSASFLARKAAAARNHRLFREVMTIIAITCAAAVLLETIARGAGL